METIMQQSLIIPSIDWFQGVFNNVDFDYILHEFLGLDNCPYEDPEVMAAIEIKLGYDAQCGFNYNGILITTSKNKLLTAQDEGRDIFHCVFEAIQLKITGEGMRFLRSINPDIERELYELRIIDYCDGAGSFHITRADFAFDLINYHIDFLGDLIAHLNGIVMNGGRAVPVLSLGRPMKFEVRSGSQSTVYIGANRSSHLLRVYDKLIESKGDLTKLPITLPDDFVLDSWCRIEMQTRNEFAHYVFYGSADPEARFKQVYNEFAFCDENREVCDFWRDLFDWEQIPSIIQKAKLWTEPVLTKSKLENRLDKLLVQVLPFLYAAPSYWLDWFADQIRRIEKDINKPGRERSYQNLNLRMKTAILADSPRDSEGKVIECDSVIRALRNVTILPHDGYNRWYLSHR